MNKLLGVCFCYVILAYCTIASALPPLGLTEINADFTTLEIIDGSAYMTGPGGIQSVSSSGDLSFITISHPILGPIDFITPVVKASDEKLYVGASFGTFYNPLGGALYDLEQPSAPVATWEGPYRVQGVARDLAVFGNTAFFNMFFVDTEAHRFSIDGSIEPLAYPAGAGLDDYTYLAWSTPTGYAAGDASIPGTAGVGPGFWAPSGEFSFLNVCCVSSSIRDRLEGDGVNVGWDGAGVKYGSGPSIYVKNVDGAGFGGWSAIVSHSDFAIIQDSLSPGQTKYAFYPGIVPGFPDRAMPLLDVFPELAGIDIDLINSLASVDGYLYMTLSGSDGTFLFGARDPSVAVPEPAGVIILSMIALWLISLTRTFSCDNARGY